MKSTVAGSSSFAVPVLTLFVALTASGCAGLRVAAAKRQYINEQTKGFVYEKPRKEVWSAVRQLVFEKGYELKTKGDEEGTFMGETEWKYEKNRTTRYLIQLNELENNRCTVNFTRMVRSEGNQTRVLGVTIPGSSSNSGGRDLEMEWELLQRVMPEKAASIASDAEASSASAAQGG